MEEITVTISKKDYDNMVARINKLQDNVNVLTKALSSIRDNANSIIGLAVNTGYISPLPTQYEPPQSKSLLVIRECQSYNKMSSYPFGPRPNCPDSLCNTCTNRNTLHCKPPALNVTI